MIREQAMFAGHTTSSFPFAWLSPFLENLFMYLAVKMTHGVHSCAASNACSDFSLSLSTGKERKTEGTAAQFCKLKR